LHIPIIHIEAGLRSYNKEMPEEINRIMTDRLSTLLFAPTDLAVNNFKSEGIIMGVHQVGDVMYDAVLYNIALAEEKHSLTEYGLINGEYVLGTIHRADNTGDKNRLQAILEAFSSLDEKVFLSLHPRTKSKVDSFGLNAILERANNIQIVEPISYLEMLMLEKHAKAIVTDSGGVQKEAYFAKVPCITLREQTEWVETIETGWNQLVNPLKIDLAEKISNLQIGKPINDLYGDGAAAEKIVSIMQDYFK